MDRKGLKRHRTLAQRGEREPGRENEYLRSGEGRKLRGARQDSGKDEHVEARLAFATLARINAGPGTGNPAGDLCLAYFPNPRSTRARISSRRHLHRER